MQEADMAGKTPTPKEIESHVAALSETLRRLHVLHDRCSDADLAKAPADGAWSANAVLAHLRSCQQVWSSTLYAMLLDDSPELPDIHPRAWGRLMEFPRRPFSENLTAFEFERGDLLHVLRDLAAADWSRTARIRGREVSVFSQVRRMADHEKGHWDQLESLGG
jgi:hypothetical protein